MVLLQQPAGFPPQTEGIAFVRRFIIVLSMRTTYYVRWEKLATEELSIRLRLQVELSPLIPEQQVLFLACLVMR